MKSTLITTALAGFLLAGTAIPPKAAWAQEATTAIAVALPDVSEQAINAADFEGWKARREAARTGLDEAQAVLEIDPPEAGGNPDESVADKADAAAAPEPQKSAEPEDFPDPFLIRLQILLDRAHASPGVIDGLDGENTRKAIAAYAMMNDLDLSDEPSAALWEKLAADAATVVQPYILTEQDLAERFVPVMPTDYGELAKLDWLGFRDAAEMLAERFHMDETLLRRLNPGATFAKAGEALLVAEPGAVPQTKVARIVVDKSKGELIAYGADDQIVLISPATIGSDGTPSPSGTMKVNGSAPDPTYEYNPDKNFKQGENHEKLTLPAGPNGPVGAMWIDLSKPTYGIHGTPEPSKIDKSASHGCVRLTNWDAQALAGLVQPARTVVEFKE
ncbi:L,D-transpeptidase family protein [Aureimonas glaciei]|uniref:Murein L,D-transpeptidase n=1 Tax=Aureimonas glaciei TaxID=1776957 RepID=A0A916Y703_9HYPH|nr:L,D-transpeptidase [Aureimonas glaciei]GGD33075.1 murein L,D-transpeptidase [Aureimonas glaciei]